MTKRIPILAKSLAFSVALTVSFAGAADTTDLSGTWSLDKSASGKLASEINQLKQEHRDYAYEHGGINDPDKPDPFARRSKKENWDSRTSGPVADASQLVENMVGAKSIKLYVSDRVIVSYDGKVKRRIQPNPNGRVHSATGKGISKDNVGETLAYIDGDAVVIETRVKTAERLVERFELKDDDRLKLTTVLKTPEWRRKVEFIRYYERQ